MASNFDNQNKKEAEPTFKLCLQKMKAVLGSDTMDTLCLMHNYGNYYLKNGHYKLAEPILNECLERRVKVLGPIHPYTNLTVQSLTSLYAKTGQKDKYREILEKH